MEHVLKTAVGVFIGGLAAAFAYEGITTIRMEIAAKKVVHAINQSAEESRRQSAIAQQAAAERAATDAQARAAAEQVERVRQAEMQRQIAAAQNAQLNNSAAKEEAWKRFYQPSDACRASWTGDCADAFIKAKRAFDAQYIPPR